MALVTMSSPLYGNVVFAGSPAELEVPYKYGFGFSNNDDWYTVGNSKSDIDERPVADGAFGILRDWRPGLPVTVVGWYRGPDRASVRAARRLLQKRVGNGLNVNMTFTDEDEITTRGLSIRSMVPGANSGLYFPITIIGLAIDPVAYGIKRVFTTGLPVSGGGLLFPLGTTPSAYWDYGADGASGRVSVTNNGTTETYPLLEVTGGLDAGFVITDVTTGEVVTVARNIPLGSKVTINQRTGSVILDGQADISGYLTSYGFFSIGPGETHVIQISALGGFSGTPQLFVTIQDANI